MKKNRTTQGREFNFQPEHDMARKRSARLKPVPKSKHWKRSIFEEEDDLFQADDLFRIPDQDDDPDTYDN